MQNLPLATTAPEYIEICTLVENGANAVKYKIANNSVRLQLMPINPHGGDTSWGPEFIATPEDNSWSNACGVRFRDAIPGAHALVSAQSFQENDPVPLGGGVPLLGTLTALGQFYGPVTNQPSATFVRGGAAQSIPTGNTTTLLLDTVATLNDPNGIISLDPATGVITLKSACWIIATGYCSLSAAAGEKRLYVIGASTPGSGYAGAGTFNDVGAASLGHIAAGGTVQLGLYQTSGGPLDVTGMYLGLSITALG